MFHIKALRTSQKCQEIYAFEVPALCQLWVSWVLKYFVSCRCGMISTWYFVHKYVIPQAFWKCSFGKSVLIRHSWTSSRDPCPLCVINMWDCSWVLEAVVTLGCYFTRCLFMWEFTTSQFRRTYEKLPVLFRNKEVMKKLDKLKVKNRVDVNIRRSVLDYQTTTRK